jgi:hypothetical protein
LDDDTRLRRNADQVFAAALIHMYHSEFEQRVPCPDNVLAYVVAQLLHDGAKQNIDECRVLFIVNAPLCMASTKCFKSVNSL